MQRVNLLILLVLALIVSSCSSVPITGRKQLNLIPTSQLNSMSFKEYDEFLAGHQLSTNDAQTQMVKKVGVNIQKAVERYFSEKGKPGELKGYRWEFNLIEDSQVNAWCMPGGKVVVYTGLMPVAKNEAGLAVVMGHEIAHAIANHGNERMSQQMVTTAGGFLLGEIIKDESETTKTALFAAYGAGAQVGVLLPFSRKHESEADRLGTIFMAMAGYDPHQAVEFWRRMASQNQGGAPPEILNTHPSDATRIKNLQKVIEEAMQYYQNY